MSIDQLQALRASLDIRHLAAPAAGTTARLVQNANWVLDTAIRQRREADEANTEDRRQRYAASHPVGVVFDSGEIACPRPVDAWMESR